MYLLAKSKYNWKLTSGYRDNQAALYAIGRTTELEREPVTDAPAGSSPHEFRLAEDLYPTADGGRSIVLDLNHPAWAEKASLVKSFNALGFGRVKTDLELKSGRIDKPHVELDNWREHKDWIRNVALACSALAVIGLLLK